MIELKNIDYYYDQRKVLDDISAVFPDGTCTCIDGPNGCGKSTLFRILSGLAFPSRGTYLLDGIAVTPERMKDKVFLQTMHRKIGYLFQDSQTQLFTRSVEDEIAFGLFQLGCSREEVHAKTEKYIAMMGLEEVRKSAPFNLSGGEKKKTALAAVLAMNPEILILDEPAASLDEDGQAWLLNFLKQIKAEKKTLILATHQKELEDAIADQTIQMNKLHQLVK